MNTWPKVCVTKNCEGPQVILVSMYLIIVWMALTTSQDFLNYKYQQKFYARFFGFGIVLDFPNVVYDLPQVISILGYVGLITLIMTYPFVLFSIAGNSNDYIFGNAASLATVILAFGGKYVDNMNPEKALSTYNSVVEGTYAREFRLNDIVTADFYEKNKSNPHFKMVPSEKFPGAYRVDRSSLKSEDDLEIVQKCIEKHSETSFINFASLQVFIDYRTLMGILCLYEFIRVSDDKDGRYLEQNWKEVIARIVSNPDNIFNDPQVTDAFQDLYMSLAKEMHVWGSLGDNGAFNGAIESIDWDTMGSFRSYMERKDLWVLFGTIENPFCDMMYNTIFGGRCWSKDSKKSSKVLENPLNEKEKLDYEAKRRNSGSMQEPDIAIPVSTFSLAIFVIMYASMNISRVILPILILLDYAFFSNQETVT